MRLELIVGPVLLLALFLGIRRLWWWYWGINRMVAALEDIAVSLRTFPTVRLYDQQVDPPRSLALAGRSVVPQQPRSRVAQRP